MNSRIGLRMVRFAVAKTLTLRAGLGIQQHVTIVGKVVCNAPTVLYVVLVIQILIGS
jgi:hypothetical protein